MPSSIASFTTPTASNSKARACGGPEQSNREKIDQPPLPVTQIHRPARLATRAASFRYGGGPHPRIPGGFLPFFPGDLIGNRHFFPLLTPAQGLPLSNADV